MKSGGNKKKTKTKQGKDMPDLIINKTKETITEKKELKLELRQENQKAKRMMYGAVILFATIIATIWFWSIKNQIITIKNSEDQNSLWNNTKNIWEDVFEETNTTTINTTSSIDTTSIAQDLTNASTTKKETDKIQDAIKKIINQTTSSTTTTNP